MNYDEILKTLEAKWREARIKGVAPDFFICDKKTFVEYSTETKERWEGACGYIAPEQNRASLQFPCTKPIMLYSIDSEIEVIHAVIL